MLDLAFFSLLLSLFLFSLFPPIPIPYLLLCMTMMTVNTYAVVIPCVISSCLASRMHLYCFLFLFDIFYTYIPFVIRPDK